MILQRGGRQGAARWIYVFALLLTCLLAACAPQLQEPGTAPAAPSMIGDRFIASDGYALPYRYWPAEKPRAVILALHGFNDYSNAFSMPGPWWAARGITVYAYDQRGFGRTEGRGLWPGAERLAQDLREIASLLATHHEDVPLYLLGDSMGGAVLLAAEAEVAAGRTAWPRPPAGLVLVAPAVWGRSTMPFLYRIMLWLAVHTMPWNTLSGRGLDILPSDNLEMLRALGRDPLIIKATRVDTIYGLVDLMDDALAAGTMVRRPTLVLYGANDEVVPKGPTGRLLDRLLAPHRAVVYAKGYHMLLRDLQAERVWTDVLAWTADAAAPLPSGEEVGSSSELRAKADNSAD